MNKSDQQLIFRKVFGGAHRIVRRFGAVRHQDRKLFGNSLAAMIGSVEDAPRRGVKMRSSMHLRSCGRFVGTRRFTLGCSESR